MNRHFVNLSDFSAEQLRALLERAVSEKALFRAGDLKPMLRRKTLAMIFEKMSLRTRVSFETAMTQLGGHAICLSPSDIGLGTREPVEDAARVLGRMCDGIMIRTFAHKTVELLARSAPVPVVNGLSDFSHPCQAMADVMTIQEHFGDPAGRTLVFVGDGNNVARSLAAACAKLGMKFVLACPPGYELDPVPADAGTESFAVMNDLAAAAADADVIYTDTWVSMGQEDQKQRRINDFADFQVNADLLAAAPDGAIVMHCLPARRGCEITDEVFEAHIETIMDEAENRLHFQRALLNVLIADGGIA